MKTQFDTASQMAKNLIGIYRDSIAKSGVSTHEFWIWYTLLEMEGDFTQQDICSMWSISKQTVNTIITNLVNKDLITLHVIPGTRNKKKIIPTEKGLEYGHKIVSPLFTAERSAFNRMSETEVINFVETMHKFLTYFEEELSLTNSETK